MTDPPTPDPGNADPETWTEPCPAGEVEELRAYLAAELPGVTHVQVGPDVTTEYVVGADD